MVTTPIEPATSGDPTYAYQRGMAGPHFHFALGLEALEWQAAAMGGSIAYRDIRRVRLSFRSVKLATNCFLAEVWPACGGKITILSTSWRSMAQLEPRERAYGAFIAELHRRLAAAGTQAVFECGVSPWLYWPGLAIFMATALALAALIVEALSSERLLAALFVAGFLTLFLWRIGLSFWRNRPGTYRPQAPPARLLPQS